MCSLLTDKMKTSLLLLIISVIAIIPSSAFSHAYLIETQPAEDAVLNEAPEKVTMQFLGYLEHFFSRVEVYDQNEDRVSDKPVLTDSDDGTTMEAAIREKPGPGEYTVKWICVSKDGHKLSGSYRFLIK